MIYVFLAKGFEEIEAITPIDLLRRCDLDVTTVGIGGKSIVGAHGITIHTDIRDDELVLGDDTQMIVLPGGMPGTLNLEKSPAVQSAVDFCIQNSKYVAAICAAPSILGNKGPLKGKKATCFPGFESTLKDAIVTDECLCVDGNIITAKGPGAAIDFSLELVSLLTSADRSKTLKDSLQCL